jgi:ketosteroid isomerase-like protein
MSAEIVELVRELHPTDVDLVDLFVRGDGSGFGMDPVLFEDDFEVQFLAESAGAETLTYRGVEGLMEAWRDWLEPWTSYHLEVEEFLDAGDKVVAPVRVRARTAHDSVAVEHAPAGVWTIRDGKIAAIRFYLDRQEAMAAAGLNVRPA